MGFFDKLFDVIKSVNDSQQSGKSSVSYTESLVVMPSSHTTEEKLCGDNDIEYVESFTVNDAFKECESHAAEVTMFNVYAPGEKPASEGDLPYIAVQFDDDVYSAVSEYREKGTFSGAMELSPLSGRFLFKAKMEYGGDMMYFYGYDRCGGEWENEGLCAVYPKRYVGTENERKIMRILDEAVESYREEKK